MKFNSCKNGSQLLNNRAQHGTHKTSLMIMHQRTATAPTPLPHTLLTSISLVPDDDDECDARDETIDSDASGRNVTHQRTAL